MPAPGRFPHGGSVTRSGRTGCRTLFDVAPAYLSPKTDEELRATLL